MPWDAGLWGFALWGAVEGEDSIAGATLYYYRDRFWTHLPKKPDSPPPVPDSSKVDWSYNALEKSKLERRVKEVLK